MAEVEKCKDCLFLTTDWNLNWTRDTGGYIQFYIDQEMYCTICDIFKKPEGYCDMWEPALG